MATLLHESATTLTPRTPSDTQRQAIEAPAGPILVLAGPGAGKTYCLIERIRFLIERLGIAPDRICAFTFTNKAAGEIGHRLESTLGERAQDIKSGTIHRFCAELLREHGSAVGLETGFGIADENYQRGVLRRLAVPMHWQGSMLTRFAAQRFRGERLHPSDAVILDQYERYLAKRNVVDFDMLLLKTDELLRDEELAATIRARWDCVLVDEFQDLNPVQYSIIKNLARDHKHIFAVGDEEQSIYSWTGADPKVFTQFINDFAISSSKIQLRENRRCPRQVVEPARRLVERNPSLFTDRKELETGHESEFPIAALTLETDDDEIAWILDDVRRDRDEHGLAWGDYALLYRTHQMGDAAESGFLAAGLPCRLAHGRALSDDPVAAYVIAALRVIRSPEPIHEENFYEVVLPKQLIDDVRAKAEEQKRPFLKQLNATARELPKNHGDKKKIRRAYYAVENLGAIGRKHTAIVPLVEELLSQRVGEYRTVLEEHHDDLTDPCTHDDVVKLAAHLDAAQTTRRPIWMPRMGGVEIALKGILGGAGFLDVLLGGTPPDDAETIRPGFALTLGLPLALFKAVQLISTRDFGNTFRDFTAVDLETTGKAMKTAEIVEIAAVRVREGKPVAEFHSLVRPRVPIEAGATKTHHITDAQVADAPYFESVWPEFRDFCGGDVLVAHNGYQFDFPILRRMAKTVRGGADLCTYDTLPLARGLHAGSARLVDLAVRFGIDPGTSHRALDDTRTLAQLFPALGEAKVARARKTALVNLLDHLGVALALSADASLNAEGHLLQRLSRPYALGRYSDCLEYYQRERKHADDETLPTVARVIELLGGEKVMQRIRAEKTAGERYPVAMGRLRRLLDQCPGPSLGEQIGQFLERVALSKSDGAVQDQERVNLLTLHSTKGLEFSRVYILGVEDAQLPGGSDQKPASEAELQESRRLLYVGMTRAKDRLVLTRVEARRKQLTGGHRFLDEMGVTPRSLANEAFG